MTRDELTALLGRATNATPVLTATDMSVLRDLAQEGDHGEWSWLGRISLQTLLLLGYADNKPEWSITPAGRSALAQVTE